MGSLKHRFGRNLRHWRKQRGLTQEQLAEMVGLTVHSISNFERGIHGPRFQHVERLSRALNIDASCLFEILVQQKNLTQETEQGFSSRPAGFQLVMK